ncbi:MAG: thiamine-phosphate kinase [Acidobacteriota bacterium]
MRGEDRLIAWLRSRADASGALLGDDAAFLPALGEFAVTVDTQTSGIHFLPGLDAAVMARRLLAVNLSDLAACGADPAFAFLALNAPADFPHRRFLNALLSAAKAHGVKLAGGDLASAAGPSATLTLIGRLPHRGRWVRRDAARPGDRLWVGGTLGQAAAGLLLQRGIASGLHPAALATAGKRAIVRHLAPRPQLDLGRWLGRQARASALDISDGLARDLHRLARASGVGAVVEAGQLPMANRFVELCSALGRKALDLMLGGGEDYVLLFTLPSSIAPPARFGATEIGSIHQGRRVRLRVGTRLIPLGDSGFDHLDVSA